MSARCAVCKGTKLQPYLVKGSDKLLFTLEECILCGGKGYIQGGRRYSVSVRRNGPKTISIDVLARNAGEALRLASELVNEAMDASVNDKLAVGDVLALEVTE